LKEAPPSIVVDANCFRYYIGEIVGEVRATYFDAFSHIFNACPIACDDEGLIRSEYVGNGRFAEYAEEEFSRLLLEDKIHLFTFVRQPTVKKFLRLCGIPKADARLVEFSVSIKNRHILSEDIDLYEPSQKNCSAIQRKKYIFQRKGSVCGEIRRKLDIYVFPCSVLSDFI